MAGAERELIEVVVACDMESGVQLVTVKLPAGATVGDAIRAAKIADRNPGFEPMSHKVGIYGRLREFGDPVQDGDRVEIYRPLIADPKEARRRRAIRDQG